MTKVFDNLLQGMVSLRPPAQCFAERGCADRHDHKLLQICAVGGVLAGAAAIGVAAHAVASGISKATGKKKVQVTEEANNG